MTVSKTAHGNQKVTDDQILTVFDESEDPYLTAGEIAEILSLTRQAVHSRLLDLYERGIISRKKTGRTVGWWIQD